MSAEHTNFYGIEEVPPTRRRAVEYVRPGSGDCELSLPPRRWLKKSDYHRLLEAERRQPWAALAGVLTVVAGVAGLFYIMS